MEKIFIKQVVLEKGGSIVLNFRFCGGGFDALEQSKSSRGCAVTLSSIK